VVRVVDATHRSLEKQDVRNGFNATDNPNVKQPDGNNATDDFTVTQGDGVISTIDSNAPQPLPLPTNGVGEHLNHL